MIPVFGEKDKFVGYCSVCGLPLLLDGKCRKYHVKKLPKRGKYSGPSKSENKFNDYK